MRAPDDLPRRRPGGRARQARAHDSSSSAVVAAFVLLTSLRGIAGFYTDYLWFDSLDQTGVWRGVLGAKVVPGAASSWSCFFLLPGPTCSSPTASRRRSGWPARRTSCSSATTTSSTTARAGADRRLPCCWRSSPGPACRRSGTRGCCSPTAATSASRTRSSAQRHRLLRLPAAVPVVRGRLAVRVAADRPHRHGGGPLPQRRHPRAAAVAAGHAPGEGPPVGAAGGAGAGQGGRLLAAALRADGLDPGHRRRRHLHRRQRAAARRSTC